MTIVHFHFNDVKWRGGKREKMRKSFYHYMLRYRNEKGKDDLSIFANNIYLDHGFPKNDHDYHEISTYLEFNGHYLKNMAIFDQAWELYTNDQE